MFVALNGDNNDVDDDDYGNNTRQFSTSWEFFSLFYS